MTLAKDGIISDEDENIIYCKSIVMKNVKLVKT